jgi:FKBP-type peptidyl-prolyl cis-trans isomerase SlyD
MSFQVAAESVVTIHYTLTAPDGEVIDSSQGGDPLAYVHGTGSLIPGLESELEGKAKGHRFDVTVEPEEGYGERDERLVHEVTRAQLPPGVELELGLQFQAQSPEGDLVVTVVGLEGDRVTLDGNHPLAGMPLHFVGEIVDVRPATEEELQHGHVHGPGGHHH